MTSLTIAHDYFAQRGGAERVAAALIRTMRPEEVITAIFNSAKTFDIPDDQKIKTSALQRFEIFRHDTRRALLFLPFAWTMFRPVTEGVVICSSSGWAHGLRVRQGVRKVVYCHNPARWLYQSDEYFGGGLSLQKGLLAIVRPALIWWDKRSAATASVYVANSTAVAERIRRAYNRTAIVIPPPVSLDASGSLEPIVDLESGFFISVGRGRHYKNAAVLVEAFAQLPDKRLVIVGDGEADPAIPNVIYFSSVSDSRLRWLYKNARGLVSVSFEDFGLTPLEANLFGTPVVVLRAGGFLDSVVEGVTGMFVNEPTSDAVREAILAFPDIWNSDEICAHAEKFSTKRFVQRLTNVIENGTPD